MNTTIPNLPYGNNTFTVTDSSSPQQTCTTRLNIQTVAPLFLSIPTSRIQSVSCNGNCDGSIDPIVSGGTTPYTLRVVGPPNASHPNGYDESQPYGTSSFIGLCEGSYTVTATDASNQTITQTITVPKILPPQINTTNINNSKQCNPSYYTIKFNIVQGTYPPPYILHYSIDGTPNTITISSGDIINGSYTLLIYQTISGFLQIYIEDTTSGCWSENLYFPITLIRKPTSTLQVSGVRNGNTVTYSATGGIAPYTFTPVNMGSSNQFTSASLVIPSVTDSVGCTDIGTPI